MLKIKNLEKKFGSVKALQDFCMHIEKESIYGLVGQNGAGKTTAIRIITGLLDFDGGSVEVGGLDLRKHIKEVKRLIGYVPDDFGNYDNIKVSEYLEFFANFYGIRGIPARNLSLDLLHKLGLSSKADSMVGSLSKGMKQRLLIARALIHNPQFLIMDEPTSGLDPKTRYEFKELLLSLNMEGKTILISSHILSELSEICTDIGIIDEGKLLISGNLLDIMEKIDHSKSLKVTLLEGGSAAMNFFQANPKIKRISMSGKTFMLQFTGDKLEEALLLKELIDNDIPVIGFEKEMGNLETFFMDITKKDKTKVIFGNDF